MFVPSVFVNRLSDTEFVASVVNWNILPLKKHSLLLTDLGLAPHDGDSVIVRDLFAKKDLATIVDTKDAASYEVPEVKSHGIQILKFTVAPKTQDSKFIQ